MKFLLVFLTALLFLLPVSLGSSHIPKEQKIFIEAARMDQMLERELNDHYAIEAAREMDYKKKITKESYTAEDVLDLYYQDKRAVKSILRGMKTSKRRELLKDVIDIMSEFYGVDKHLAKAVAKRESHYNPNAKSYKGAVGIMQLMPLTAKEVGVKDRYNAIENIEGGLKYLSYLLKKYNGNVKFTLAAYNAGPSRVFRYKGIPPFKETIKYVNIVMKYKKDYHRYDQTI